MNIRILVLVVQLITLMACQPPLTKTRRSLPDNSEIQSQPILNNYIQLLDLESTPAVKRYSIDREGFTKSKVIESIQVTPLLLSGSKRQVTLSLSWPGLILKEQPIHFYIPRPIQVSFPFLELKTPVQNRQLVGPKLEHQLTIQAIPLLFQSFDLLALKIELQHIDLDQSDPQQTLTVYALADLSSSNQSIPVNQIVPHLWQDNALEWLDFIRVQLLNIYHNIIYHQQELSRLKKKSVNPTKN